MNLTFRTPWMLALFVALIASPSIASAQTDVDSVLGATNQRGSTKVQSRVFNPFAVSGASHLSASTFGFPTGLSAFQAAPVNLYDPFAAPAENSLVVNSVSGGQVSGGQAPVLSAASGWPTSVRPVRSPYRPPPRGSF